MRSLPHGARRQATASGDARSHAACDADRPGQNSRQGKAGVSGKTAAAMAAVAAAAIVLAGCGNSAPRPAQLRDTSARTPASAHAAQIGRSGQHAASLAVLSGAAAITVTTSAPAGQLVRVSTPADSQVRPELTLAAGRVQVFLSSTGQSGPAAVLIQVNPAVAWQFQFSGGASQTVLDMAGGAVAGVDFTAGCSLIDLTLPRPDRTVTITLAGGASQVNLTTPAGVPSRLRLYGGASMATLLGATRTGLAGGTVLVSPGWPAAVNRYDVVAPAGVSQISVATGQ